MADLIYGGNLVDSFNCKSMQESSSNDAEAMQKMASKVQKLEAELRKERKSNKSLRQQLERTKEKLRISRGKKSTDDIIREDRSQAQHYQEQLNQLTQSMETLKLKKKKWEEKL